jgi:peptide/nickel transport system substrate-binding protein
MKTKRIVSLLLVAMMLFTLAACGGKKAETPANETPASETPASETASNTDSITMALAGEIPSLDVQNSSIGATGSTLIRAVYENLFLFNSKTMEIIPNLVESYEWVDELTFKMKLREDVTSSSGEKFTASDVLFVLGRGAACKELGNKYGYLDVANSYAEGDYVVYLKVPSPYVALPYLLSLSCFGMYCQKDYETVGADAWGRAPVGIGPYTIDEWVSGDHATLTLRDDYWGEGYTFKHITVRFISDANARAMALQSKDVDLAENIPASMVDAIANTDGLRVEPQDKNRVLEITPNMDKVEAFANPKVREAMNIGVDKESIAAAITMGTGKPANGLFCSKSPYWRPTDASTYDLERAKELMKEAGYENGFSFTLNVWNGYQDYLDLANALQAEYAKLNITMTINPMDAGGFYPSLTDCEAYMINMVGFVPEDAMSLYDSAQADGGSNNTRYRSAEFDAAFYAAMGEQDEAKRLEYIYQASDCILKDTAILSYVEAENMVGIREDLVRSELDFDPIGLESYLHISTKG